MTKVGYYLEKYNFSVERCNGVWAMRVRLDKDKPATTQDEIRAVEMHAETNRRKFCEGQAA